MNYAATMAEYGLTLDQLDGLVQRTLANGGGTFDPRDGADVTTGYAVAVVNGTYRRVDRADVDGLARAIDALWLDWPGAFIGTWLDGETVHVDPVQVWATERDAAQYAVEREQLAYYVLHEGREVRLPA